MFALLVNTSRVVDSTHAVHAQINKQIALGGTVALAASAMMDYFATIVVNA
jgi:hypothetical protein